MKNIFLLLIFCNLIFVQSYSQNTDTPKPLGKLADLGGYKLHYILRGRGEPTAVLIAGSMAFSFDWTLVQNELSKFAKVLSYDRPGLAWSDTGPEPRSFKQDVYELHKLLEKIKIKPPYILVGHSIGGIIARQYAKEYPDEISGMVLLDATSENSMLMINGKVQRLRLLSSGKTIPPLKYVVDTFTKVPSQKEVDDNFKMFGKPKTEPPFDKLPPYIQQIRIWASTQPKYFTADNGSFWAEEFQKMYADSSGYSLGKIPLIVLSSIRNEYPKELGDSIRNALIKDKIDNHNRMLRLSSNSKKIETNKSGHEIHLTEPGLVVEAIREIIYANRYKKKLS